MKTARSQSTGHHLGADTPPRPAPLSPVVVRYGITPSGSERPTQQRALASNYSLFVFTGLSYSFGSIYNSVVNPRLDFFNLGGGN